MIKENLNRAAGPILVVAAICSALLIAGCFGPSAAVKGTILQHSGEPLAEKEVILIPLLPDDKVAVIEEGPGVFMKYEAGFDNLEKPVFGGLLVRVICEADRRGVAKWKTKTDDKGSFVITNVDPGKYVLFQSVAGRQIKMGTKEGWIRIDVKEGQTNELGTITLLDS